MSTAQRLRERVAFESARLLYGRVETDYPRAKRKAARSIGARLLRSDMPTNREVREQMRRIASLVEQEKVRFDLRQGMIEALRLMRWLKDWQPRLLDPDRSPGSDGRPAWTELEIHLHGAALAQVTERLATRGVEFQVQESRWGHGLAVVSIQIETVPSCRLVIREEGPDETSDPARAWLDTAGLERALLEGRPETDLEAELDGLDPRQDRFEMYRYFLARLEDVVQFRRTHPEGDALYHSLQVFELAVAERPYDEEFLTAALLHDVGRTVDASDHVAAGLDLLEGLVTHRTRWLIAHHEEALRLRARELPAAQRHVLEGSEDFEDLLLLAELDEHGRMCGVQTRTVHEALDYLRRLEDGSLFDRLDRLDESP